MCLWETNPSLRWKSGVWIRREICTEQAQSKNSSKLICGRILMWETTGDGLFHWRKRYYGQTHSFCLLKMLTDGLEWCGLLVDCDVFISCLDSHSDGTHSLQSIHWWENPAMLNFSKSFPTKKQLIYILDGLRVSKFSTNFHFHFNRVRTGATLPRSLQKVAAAVYTSMSRPFVCLVWLGAWWNGTPRFHPIPKQDS